VINAGGIINVSFEKNYDAAASTAKVEQIYNTLLTIFERADSENRTTGSVADEMAKAIIDAAR
jgi:leucine dehydrogenase